MKLRNWTYFAVLFCCGVVGVDSEWVMASEGRQEAQEYFKARQSNRAPVKRTPSASSVGAPRYLAIHAGGFMDGEVYKWGDNDGNKNNGTFGVTYRVGEWRSSMDLLFRADLLTYSLEEGRATKLSLLPVIAFPDANSGFPLYFGAGIGAGIFLKQIEDEGELSLDYQLIAGARFFDVFGSTGFLFELGLKNHVHILSDGQSHGTFVAIGSVFAF